MIAPRINPVHDLMAAQRLRTRCRCTAISIVQRARVPRPRHGIGRLGKATHTGIKKTAPANRKKMAAMMHGTSAKAIAHFFIGASRA
jgi:hypothetical protein